MKGAVMDESNQYRILLAFVIFAIGSLIITLLPLTHTWASKPNTTYRYKYKPRNTSTPTSSPSKSPFEFDTVLKPSDLAFKMDDNLIAAIFYSAVDPYAARHFFTNRCLWFNAFKHVVLTNQDQLRPGFNNKKSYVPIISARKRVLGSRKIGLLQYADEHGGDPMEIYPDLAFVFRHYYFQHKQTLPHTRWIPNGFNPVEVSGIFTCMNPTPVTIPDAPIKDMQAWPRESCYCKMANARASKRPFEWSFIGNERRTRMDMAKVLREYFKDIPVFHDQNFDDLRELNGSKAVMVLRQLGWGGPRNSYWQVLANSKFSLCPCGNNPETHRFWESLWVGAIPIVERCEPDKNKFWADHLGFDKFITVNNWGEVKDKIQPYLNNPEELDKLWHETNSWFFCFLRKMQNDIAQVITTNYLRDKEAQ